jgi:DNA-binding transcriptional LysR family regulator
MADLSIASLRVVREVARLGSFSAAADRLGYTQSAVSRQVAGAEQVVGRTLFVRHARGVRPTTAGRVVARRAEAVLIELEAARQEIEDLGAEPAGRVRVGAFSTALAALVPRALNALAERRPQAEVIIREGSSEGLLGRVASRRLDLAVVTPPARPPEDVRLTTLLEDPLLVAVAGGHPLAGRRSVAPDELARERWIAGSADPSSTLLGAWTGSRWQPRIGHVAREWTAKLGLVAAGRGVTVVPGLAAPAVPPTLSLVRLDHPRAIRVTAAATPAGGSPSPLAAELIEALRDVAGELGAELRHSIGG